MLENLRRGSPSRALGDAIIDQRAVAGIGNMWKAEALWRARLSPWLRLGEVTDDELAAALGEAAGLMRRALEGGREPRTVYRRAEADARGGALPDGPPAARRRHLGGIRRLRLGRRRVRRRLRGARADAARDDPLVRRRRSARGHLRRGRSRPRRRHPRAGRGG